MLLVSSSVLAYYADHLVSDQSALDLESAGKDASFRDPSKLPTSNPKASLTADSFGPSDGESNIATPLREIHAPNSNGAGDGIPTNAKPDEPARSHSRWTSARTIAQVADWLRWTGKTLATINAIGLVASSLFQFAGFYTNCYCDSSVFWWGASAFNVINPSGSDIALTQKAWIGGLALALTCCSVFVGSIYLIRDSVPS